jgi:hypothetical protein
VGVSLASLAPPVEANVATTTLPPLPPTPRRGWRRPIVIGLVVAVILAVVLAGIVFLAAGTSGTSDIPFSTARHLADARAAGISNSTGNLVLAVGIDQPTVTSVSLGKAAAANCTAAPFPGAPTSGNLAIPSSTASFSAGVAPLWVMLYDGKVSSTWILIVVTSGSATPIATLSGTACAAELGGLHAITSGFVDSPVAASASWSGGGPYTGAAMSMVAVGGGTYNGTPIGPSWLLYYAPCGILSTGPGVSTVAIVADVGGTTGTFVGSITHATSCPG